MEEDKYKPKHAKDKKGIRKETIAIIISIIAGIAISLLILLNFQQVSGFARSMFSDLTGFFSGEADAQIEEAPEEAAPEAETKDIPEEDEEAVQEETPEEIEEEEEEDEEAAGENAPAISIEIYEGPLYSEGDDLCYYRVRTLVTG